MLESLDKTNIKNLIIEAPEKEDSGLLFDFERDVTKADIEGMKEELVKHRLAGNWGNSASVVLFFEAHHIPYPPFTEEEINRMKEQIADYRDLNNWYSFAQTAVFFDLHNIPYKPLTPEEQTRMQTKFNAYRANGWWNGFTEIIPFFDRHNIPYKPLTLEEQTRMQKKFNKFRANGWWSFVAIALYLEAHQPRTNPKLKSDLPPKPPIRNF